MSICIRSVHVMNIHVGFIDKFKKKDFRRLCIMAIMTLIMTAIITIMSTWPGLAGIGMFGRVEAADVHNYPTVAVMQFGNKAITSQGMRAYDFDSASEYAIYQLVASGWFDLVDYEQLGNIAKMHQINMSGLVDQSTAVQLGKVAGAQFMMVGNVTGLTTKKSGMNYQHGSAGSAGVDVRTVIANVAVRLVDIETGKIVGAGLGKGESASSSVEVVFKKYRKPRTDLNATTTYNTPYGLDSNSGNNSSNGNENNGDMNNGDMNNGDDSVGGSDEDDSTVVDEGDANSVVDEDDVDSVVDDSLENEIYDTDELEDEVYDTDELDEIEGDYVFEDSILADESDIDFVDSVDDDLVESDYYRMPIEAENNVVRNILIDRLSDDDFMVHFMNNSNSSDMDSYYNGIEEYSIRIGSQNFSAVQVRNAISKAVRDAIYGDMGLMTMLNDGKKLKVKTGF